MDARATGAYAAVAGMWSAPSRVKIPREKDGSALVASAACNRHPTNSQNLHGASISVKCPVRCPCQLFILLGFSPFVNAGVVFELWCCAAFGGFCREGGEVG